MEIKKTLICSATQKSTPEETTLFKSLEKLDIDADVHFFLENDRPLAEVYNDALCVADEKDVDALILVHDDVSLVHDPTIKLGILFDDYDVVGVAGCSKAEIKSPALWHLMGGGFGGGHLHGNVFHEINGNIAPTYFGLHPHRVTMIDGLFMALNRKSITELSFDEKCPSKFHFYDICFSAKAHLDGYKVGVGDIQVIHESQGLREFSDDWLAGEKYFLENYGN